MTADGSSFSDRRHDSYTHHDKPCVGAMTLIFTMTHYTCKLITVFYLVGKEYYFTIIKSAATGS
jgi:hypothetical protein